MKFSLITLLQQTKIASLETANLSSEKKKKILLDLADILMQKKKEIFSANVIDVQMSIKNKKNTAFIDRLTCTEKSFANMIEQVKNVAKQKDYLHEIIEEKTIANGVLLQKIRVPLGVIGIIYESRPNVTIDVAAICIKSGNAVILRGGSDAFYTNKILVDCIYKALKKNNVTEKIVGFVQDTDRLLVTKMLQQEKYIDVIIPRGGYELVKKVVAESKIPVLYHASGGARIYIDKSADIKMAVDICINAKISRPATCNSLDTILVHKDIAKEFLLKFAEVLHGRAEIRADKKAYSVISNVREKSQSTIGVKQGDLSVDSRLRDDTRIKLANKKDFETEFLDYKVCLKVVKNAEEAISFIQKHTNKHSEGIIAEDKKTVDQFTNSIDAAALFVNCSTRLHDGGMFQLGAEMGIATGKLHARGPVGAKELTTYKWVATGNGQTRE